MHEQVTIERFEEAGRAERPAAGAVPGRLRKHPLFRAAMRASMLAGIELYRGNRLLNALATDRARLVLSVLALYLHHADEPGQPHAGLTVTRAKQVCARTGLCSPGRAAAILALMQWAGYLETAPRADDRRIRRLLPTERLLALHRDRWRRQIGAAALVIPELRGPLGDIEDPRFTPAFAIVQSRAFLSGFRVAGDDPAIMLFAERDCGMLILFSALSSAFDGGRFDDLPISVSALARQFGVSRAHVNRLLTDADRAGLLRYLARHAPAISIGRDLLDAAEAMFERLFGFNAACAFEASAAIRAAGRPAG